jgi:hypothetical protein
MTALEKASHLLAELDRRHVPYQLQVVRPEALMVSVAIPGERWEIEFFDDDDRVEVERFISQGVEAADGIVPGLLSYFDDP